MRQRASFWSWRAATSAGRVVQLAIMAGVLFVFVLALGEVTHKPILADHVPPHHFMPAAHTK